VDELPISPQGRLGRMLRSLPFASRLGEAGMRLVASMRRSLQSLRTGSPEVEAVRDGIVYRLDIGEYVQMRIFFDRVVPTYEVAELEFAKRVLRPGDVAVDVGAHVGLYALTFSREVGPAGRVLALEPDPRNRERLEANIGLNAFAGNVAMLAVAASDEGGTAVLHLSETSSRNSFYSLTDTTMIDAISVEKVTLDDCCARQGVSRVRLLKIDVEGHEPAVLRGASGLLSAQAIDYVMLEYVGDRVHELGLDGVPVDALFASGGYRRIFPKSPPQEWPQVVNLVYASPAAEDASSNSST